MYSTIYIWPPQQHSTGDAAPAAAIEWLGNYVDVNVEAIYI
jgi:hypothetical protein